MARTLSLLGGCLPAELVPPNEGNPHGHWEPQAIVDLNDRMLADAGSDLYSTLDCDPRWCSTPRAKAFMQEALGVLDAAYGSDPFIIIKDPRVALLLPIWDEALTQRGYAIKHLLPLRHPKAVAQSLKRRHLKTIAYDAWQRPRGELVWLRYTLAAVRGSRDRARSFVAYEAFFEDWRRELKRVASELGIVWPRFGTAEAQVDAFLQRDGSADIPVRSEAGPAEQAIEDLDFAELAARLYDSLSTHGDLAADTDRIAAEYRTRTSRTRDLVTTLENLYPLVWAHYEEAGTERRRNEAARAAERILHGNVQTLWSDLAQANDQKNVLRHDLFTARERIEGLEREIGDTRTAVDHRDAMLAGIRSELEGSRKTLVDVDHALRETRIEFDAVIEDREAVRADGEETRAGLLQSVEDLTQDSFSLTGELDRLRAAHAELHRRFESMRRSTSWTITRPLRVIGRLLGRRPRGDGR